VRHGRKAPYTVAGVRRLLCARCQRRKAAHQWRCCADSLWRPICRPCDVALNRMVLRFMRDPERVRKMHRYMERAQA
jgi:hypothetical protein